MLAPTTLNIKKAKSMKKHCLAKSPLSKSGRNTAGRRNPEFFVMKFDSEDNLQREIQIAHLISKIVHRLPLQKG